MDEKNPRTPDRTDKQTVTQTDAATSPQPARAPQGPALYLRWLGILCAIMAAFCLGVFLIGYKDPSAGRVATLVGLIVASVASFWLSHRKLGK